MRGSSELYLRRARTRSDLSLPRSNLSLPRSNSPEPLWAGAGSGADLAVVWVGDGMAGVCVGVLVGRGGEKGAQGALL